MSRYVPPYAYVVIALGWLVWTAPFILLRRSRQEAPQVDRSARWGILLVAAAYSLLWQGRFWERPLPVWRLLSSVLFLALASLLSWTATRALGRHWRMDAALDPDHQLVTSGPYRLVRHPIYTSMLCLELGTGFMLTPPLLLAFSVALFMWGTHIRVHAEETLLASRFGARFGEYQRAVPAYIPFLQLT